MVELSAKNYFSFKWNNVFLIMRKRWLRKLKLGKTCFFFSENKEKPIFRIMICVFIIAFKAVGQRLI